MQGRRLCRTATIAALTFAVTMAAGDVPALGVELPPPIEAATGPALGAGPAIAATPQLPATPALPVQPQAPPLVPELPSPLPVGPPATPASPAPPGPAGGQAVAAPSSAPATARKSGRAPARPARSPEGSGAGNRSGAQAFQGRSSSAASTPRRRTTERRTTIRRGSRAFRLFHPSQLGRLGEFVTPGSPSSVFLGDFSEGATRGATWAPPLLAIMLLIGLWGFLRVARAPRRRRP